MSRPRLLDLFCGAGGAAVGYHRAGFDVVGVDIVAQPRYPFEFIQADAMTFDLEGYDAIHASPVCHRWSKMRDCRPGLKEQAPDLLTPTRERLLPLSVPWVIENVPGAPLRNPAQLCGSAFGLPLQRHRWFESTVPLWSMSCVHGENGWNPAYKHATNRKRRRVPVIGEWRIPLALQREAMGIDWMTLPELTEAIPPAYTEFIGEQLLAVLSGRAEGKTT